MKDKTQRRKDERLPTAAKRRHALLLVRAFAGALVLCALLAPHALAQDSTAQPQAPNIELGGVETKIEKFPVINTKPFSDLLRQGKRMMDAGELDFSTNVEIEVEGDRLDDGHLTNVVVTSMAASNPKLLQLSKDFIAAVSDSKVLSVLRGIGHFKMKVGLADNFSVRLMGETASADEASSMSQGYKGLLYIGAMSKRGRDEEVIFKSINVTSEAEQIVLTLDMPRKAAGDLLSKLIRKTEATTAAAAPAPAN
jgi:hypothetical protein